MKTFRKGFTLIELLVVIAIIGILASIVLVSLNQARARARDANRVSSLQEMAKFIAVNEDGSAPTPFWDAASNGNAACQTSEYCSLASDTNPPVALGVSSTTAIVTNFQLYIDPTAGTSTTACYGDTGGPATPVGTPCAYSMSYIDTDNPVGTAAPNPDSQHYEICAMLEGSIGGYDAGLVHVGSDTGGSVQPGCY
jgi:prepilin-type N-terminal cleavage/methylation domain-containing protein